MFLLTAGLRDINSIHATNINRKAVVIFVYKCLFVVCF
jgi:hypothetical protein